MSEYNSLSVELEVLAQHAENRYEDAYVCDAIGMFVDQVGTIPRGVWGRFPWVGRWAREWETAKDFRVSEARTARNVFGHTAASLHQVLADTAGTDVALALDFQDKATAAENSLRPYLDALKPGPLGTARPGGDIADPRYYQGGPPKVTHDGNTATGQRLNRLPWGDRVNSAEMASKGATTRPGPTQQARTYYADTPGKRELVKFVNDHYAELRKAEFLVDFYGPGLSQYPSKDFIDEAIPAWPRVIFERADMMNLAAQNYEQLKNLYTADFNALRDFWSSPSGSRAYFIHANEILKYLGVLKTEAEWLAAEGKEAGQAVDKLMMAYAKAGYDRIGIIIKHSRALQDAVSGPCKNGTKDPVQALIGVLNAFVSVLLADLEAANDVAKSILALGEAAQGAAPDLGDAAHTAKSFSPPTSGENWEDSRWSPGRATIPVMPVT
jgi:hypothetical protein